MYKDTESWARQIDRRKMSASVENQTEGPLLSDFHVVDDAHSELGDGSSSLSDIEDKEAEQDELDEIDDLDSENEDESDANDSEAETERLENSPQYQRKPKDVVLSSQAETRTYDRSPSKLQHQFNDDEEDEEDDNDLDNLSDDDGSLAESTKSIGMEGVEQDPTTATTSLEDSSGEGKGSMATMDNASKKRKRSLLPERGLADASVLEELEEPARKRTGSIAAGGDDYAIDDTISVNGDAETSNPISGDISDAESNDLQDDEDEDIRDNAQDDVGLEDEADETPIKVDNSRAKSERKKGWKKRGGSDNPDAEGEDANNGLASVEAVHDAADGEDHDETVDVDVDEAEMALKNEEERRFSYAQIGPGAKAGADRLLQKKGRGLPWNS